MGTGCFVSLGLVGGGLSPSASPPAEPKEWGMFMEALEGRKGGRARLGREQSGGTEPSAWAPHSSSPLLVSTFPSCPAFISICNLAPTPHSIPIPAEPGITLCPAADRSCGHPLTPTPKQSQDHASIRTSTCTLTCELYGDLEGDSAWHPRVFLHEHVVPVLPEGQVLCQLAGSVFPAVQCCRVVQGGSLGPHTQPEWAALSPTAPQHLHEHS